MAAPDFLHADWPSMPGVHALTTTRAGGVSLPPYGSLNLGDHVGDDAAAVAENRARLAKALALPGPPRWLNQVHGVAVAGGAALETCPTADAAVTRSPGEVLAILTADCLPVVLAEKNGTGLGVAHAGWRSLAGGVIAATVAALATRGDALAAWLGPAIGPGAFEVGDEVRHAFMQADEGAFAAFAPGRPGHWWCDLYALARRRLRAAGVTAVYGGERCTFAEPDSFFSYRRDGQCGRMATLVWRDAV